MKVLAIVLTASLLLALPLSAQTMTASSEAEVSQDSVQIRSLYDIDSGVSACRDALSPMCSTATYDCDYGTASKWLDTSTLVATYRGYQSFAGIRYNIYDCRATCLATCNAGPPPSPKPLSPACGQGCSPLIVDLSASGVRMTDAASGVLFDITGDGRAELISWTEGGDGDGFIVLDRNGNGLIDNASELFGDGTPQPDSSSRNGFAALGVYDDPAHGGNGDGHISAADAIWSHLRLWVDRSHDGASEPGELAELDGQGFLSIDLTPVESRAKDRYGNEFRYRAKVRLSGAPPQTEVIDVFLLLD